MLCESNKKGTSNACNREGPQTALDSTFFTFPGISQANEGGSVQTCLATDFPQIFVFFQVWKKSCNFPKGQVIILLAG